jgi:hypothetical protein
VLVLAPQPHGAKRILNPTREGSSSLLCSQLPATTHSWRWRHYSRAQWRPRANWARSSMLWWARRRTMSGGSATPWCAACCSNATSCISAMSHLLPLRHHLVLPVVGAVAWWWWEPSVPYGCVTAQYAFRSSAIQTAHSLSSPFCMPGLHYPLEMNF